MNKMKWEDRLGCKLLSIKVALHGAMQGISERQERFLSPLLERDWRWSGAHWLLPSCHPLRWGGLSRRHREERGPQLHLASDLIPRKCMGLCYCLSLGTCYAKLSPQPSSHQLGAPNLCVFRQGSCFMDNWRQYALFGMGGKRIFVCFWYVSWMRRNGLLTFSQELSWLHRLCWEMKL